MQKENILRNELKAAPKAPKRKAKAKKSMSLSMKADPRIRKIIGLLMLSFTVFLTLALVSFIFSWKTDQSAVKGMNWETIKVAVPEMTQNWMGLFGAWISHLLIYRWFGIAAFTFVPLLFLSSIRLLFNNKLVSLLKAYSLGFICILFFTLCFGFMGSHIPGLAGSGVDYLGGALGFQAQQWLGGLVGVWGVGMLLIIAVLSFLVIVYDFDFKIPSFAKKDEPMVYGEFMDDMPENAGQAIMGNEELEDEEDDEDIDDEDFKLIVVPDKKTKSNEIDFTIKEPIHPKPLLTDVNEPVGYADAVNRGSLYVYPSLSLLKNHESNNAPMDPAELEERKNLIVETLENYKIKIDRIEATIGPTVTLYEIVPAAGIRISRIKSLEDDIALSLAALGIRIIAPMPGKGTIGIEVPNQNPEIVSLKEALSSQAFRTSTYDLPVALGKTISNEVFVADLTKMPHLLMAGATGQGKSVGINTIIASIIFKKHPDEVKFILVDPKKVELSLFKHIEKHFLPELPDGQEAIITDTKMVVDVLKSLCVEMDKRYDSLKDAGVRNIKEYNKKIEKGQLDQAEHKRLPYIILVIDELADLMMTAGKEVELPIARLAQLARAIGIHLIVATQRPSVNIITGTIKANFPARIAFRVTSRIDSRTILDTGGSEQLIGRGDMLYSTGNEIMRLQCPFIDTEEVDAVTKFIESQPYPEPFRLNIITDEMGEGMGDDEYSGDLDPLFEDAARLIVNTQQGSTSMLQRRLKLGYNRAGRLMDQLEKAKIVGGNEGSKAREVLFADEYALEQFLKDRSLKMR